MQRGDTLSAAMHAVLLHSYLHAACDGEVCSYKSSRTERRAPTQHEGDVNMLHGTPPHPHCFTAFQLFKPGATSNIITK